MVSGGEDYLPRMQTDITIRKQGRTIVVDTKFYEDSLQKRYDTSKIRSGHLYQLCAYLRNLSVVELNECAGILLYPTTTDQLDLRYEIEGRSVEIRTVDLTLPWQQIDARLLSLVQ